MMLLGVLASAIKKAIGGGGGGPVAIKALYWRVLITSHNGSAYDVEVRRIRMYSAVNGVDICTGGTPFASSTYPGGGYEPAKAFGPDLGGADYGNSWASSGGPPCFIGYQFAAPVTLAELQMKASYNENTNQMPCNFQIQSSDDGLYYVTRATIKNQTGWANSEVRTFAVDSISTGNNRWNNIVSRMLPSGVDTGTTFTDPNGHTWVPTVCTIDYSQGLIQGQPWFHMGGSTSAQLKSEASEDFDFAGDFYIRGWFMLERAAETTYMLDIGNNGCALQFRNGLLSFYAAEFGTGHPFYTSGPTPSPMVPHYAEISRYNGVIHVFFDGVQWTPGAASTFNLGATTITYGNCGGSNSYGGSLYLSGWEAGKGVAGHLNDYPMSSPTVTPALPGDFYGYDSLSPAVISQLNMGGASGSTVFNDDTGRQWTANGAAQIATDKGWPAFKGAGDSWLTTPLSQDFNFGADPFALEVWAVPTLAADSGIFSKRDSGAAGYAWQCQAAGQLWLRAKIGGTYSDTQMTTTQGSVLANVLQHFSFAFDGSLYTLAVNGKVCASLPASAGALDMSEVVGMLGGSSSSGHENAFQGEIRAWRATRGDSRGQTRNFSPDVAPFPQIGGSPRSYWRVRVLSTNALSSSTGDDLTAGLCDIQMGAFPGGPQLCTGGTAIASTSYNGSYSGVQAFDANSDTWWNSANGDTSPWVGYQFASPTTVNEVRIQGCTSNGALAVRVAKTFAVESSDDGVVWLPEWSVKGQQAWVTTEIRQFTRPKPLHARKAWRLFFNSLATGNDGYADLAELGLHSVIGGPQVATGGTAFASTYFISSSGATVYGPSNAFDGNPTTIWASSSTSTGVGSFIGYLFSTPVGIQEFSITADTNYPNRAPGTCVLQSSNDTTTGTDGTWTNEFGFCNQQGWGAGEVRTFARGGANTLDYSLPAIVQSIAPAAAIATAGLVLHLDAGALATADGDAISAWADLSPAATASTLNGTMVMRRTGMGGNPGVDCSAPGYLSLPSTFLSGSNAGTVIAVMKSLASDLTAANGNAIGLGPSGGSYDTWTPYSSSALYDANLCSGRVGPVTMLHPSQFGAPYLYTAYASSAGGAMRINSVQQMVNPNAYQVPANPAVGYQTGDGRIANSLVSEVLVYSRVLSDDELYATEQALRVKWGTG